MDVVTVRELRNNGGEVLTRVARGERLAVTRDGVEVAELRPRTRRSPAPADLVARRRTLPAVAPRPWRADVDELLDPSL
ncbi:type II toxin-antitoxin system Phd/YefM family antitoxin [Klenkia sp. PcliD-1-E]|uniref:type II toxin-antitoxin system Phd/YefM family antitoxin n=1 Tax=Klenkia sp. PcliD-1-E TaxID=2954492 RepID=UPI002096C8E1|nr:type II toxin-antitoxin system prevent-host-death family antitoxin [Klenkia sp. PcliD-1-E]MCO7218933.1 type II toxin-antitoxin system prevent-host-death family antitoxin [Klenkia sp. PcliD-1-E]